MMFTAALATIAKIYEQAKCPANIPKAELEDDDGAVGRGLLGKNYQNVVVAACHLTIGMSGQLNPFRTNPKNCAFFFFLCPNDEYL